MIRSGLLITLILFVGLFSSTYCTAWAASDGYYTVTEATSTWDGTDGNTLNNPTTDYDYAYGDEEKVTYSLPWAVTFYGQSYSSITADTNGNVWFSATDAAYAFNLSSTGRGPVMAAWNNDLSSSFQSGVFIQHKTNPERIVIEWQAETYTEQGASLPNNFAVVIYPNGSIRYDYSSFTTQSGDDFGSGISRGDGSASLNLTTLYGNAFGLSGRSFLFSPQSLIAVNASKSGQGSGTTASSPPGIACGATCTGNFAQGTILTLTSAPDFGSVFDGWSGACSGTGPCTINIDSAKNISASYSPTQSPMVAISSPSGVITTKTPTLNYIVSTGTVVVKVDGVVVNKLSGTALDALADGPHVLRVESINSGGYLGFAESSFTIDATPPAIASVTPATGSSNVPVRMSILVQFTEQIDLASVTANTVALVSQGIAVPGDIRLSSDGKSFIFKPQNKLNYAASYTFTLKAGVRDLLGNTQNSDQTSTFSTPMLDPDLVGYWPMDEDWKDYSGHGNNGTAYGSSAFTGGRVSSVASGNFVIDSAVFPGSGGFVDTPPEFIDGTPDNFTMSFWAKPTATRESTPETNGNVVSGEGVQRFAIAPVNFYNLGWLGATAGVSVGTNGISVFEETTIDAGDFMVGYMPSLLVYDSPTPLTDWNHIAVVYNNKQPKLYLNGVLVRTGLTSLQYEVYPSAVFAFGNERTTGAYSGQLEGIVYHKKALTAQEIQALYQKQSQSLPQIAITSPGQTIKYKPGEAGSATVSVTSTTGITRLYCSASGATSDGGLVINFEQPQTQTTQQLNFHVAENATPYAPILLSCVAQTPEGFIGIGEVQMQAADIVPPSVVSSTPPKNAIDISATMPIFIYFSEPIDPASLISHDTFKFQRTDNGAWVSCLYRLASDNTAMQIVPSPALDSATSYTMTFSRLRDLAGNALVSDYVLQFTTLQQTSVTVSNQGTSAAPYVLSTGRYGTVTLNNSYVTVSGGVAVDTLTMDHSILNVSLGTLGTPGDLSVAYGDMLVSNGSQVIVDGTLNLAANLNLTNSSMSFTGTGAVAGNVVLNTGTVTLKNPLQVAGNVTLQNNSLFTHYAATATDTSKLDVTAANMIVDATSKIDVTGKGYLGGFQGGNNVPEGRTIGNTINIGSDGCGASYGGTGGGCSMTVYGDIANPNDLGSGGGGAIYDAMDHTQNLWGNSGGGLIRLNIVGTLSLDGIIGAEGAASGLGAGSGGGIRIDAGNIFGSGKISANGGSSIGTILSFSGGGGGGGRIAIYYDSLTLPVGNIIARGGLTPSNTPAANGGAGTIYLKNSARSKPDLIISNGSNISTNSTIMPGGNFGVVDITAGTNVIVNGDYAVENDLVLSNVKMTVNGTFNIPISNLFITQSSLTVNGNFNLLTSNLLLTNSSLNVIGTFTVSGSVALDNSILSVSAQSPINVSTLTLKNGSVLSHGSATTTAVYKLDITAGTIEVDATSKIDVTGKGYLAGNQGNNSTSSVGRTYGNVTTGGSAGSSGGSYGGLGGYYSTTDAVGASYGSLLLPNELGSGGGGLGQNHPGGNGGGLVKLNASSILLNGSILADGENVTNISNGGAGSGGGILINTGALSGTGLISAKGGSFTTNNAYGSGGGGRIAIYYSNKDAFQGSIQAYGGKSGNGTGFINTFVANGGAGTIYLKDSAKAKGDVIISNGGVTTSNVTSVTGGDYGFVSVTGGAKINVAGDISFDRDVVLTGSNLAFNGGITTPGNLILDGSNITVSGAINAAGALTLKNGSVLSHGSATTTAVYKLDITAGTIEVDATSKIDVTGKGYLAGYQDSNSGSNIGRTNGNVTTGGSVGYSGGSYGGLGGYYSEAVAATYGSLLFPNELGSGGGGALNWLGQKVPGGNGGGLVKLNAGSILLNGSILADGANVSIDNSYGGAGSGGGILINVGTLSGSGTISAKGGSFTLSTYNGSGGGGRIAVYYSSNTLPSANIKAYGGKSGVGTNAVTNAGAGTIYLKDSAKAKGDVIVNNGGVTTSNVTPVIGGDYGLVSVTGGAKISAAGDISSDRDIVFTGSNLTFNGGITTSGNLTLDGSNITVNGPVNVATALTLKNGSVLSHSAATTTASYKLDVTAASIDIDANSKIDVSGLGYLAGYQGSNNSFIGRTNENVTIGGSVGYSGGSYGGLGGRYTDAVGATYGSLQLPNELGSGGGGVLNWLGQKVPGGNGGGLVKLSAGSILLNGSILADGANVTIDASYGGAGSGGGILITASALAGSGTISAKGGSFTLHSGTGSGGGGRIAVYYNTNSLPAANIVATGGKSGNGSNAVANGGNGTIYLYQNVFPLTVTKAGTGAGTVQSAPAGLTCGSTCTVNFPKTSGVTLTASPDNGSAFTGWTGACTGTSTCTVTMDAAKTVMATFTVIPPPTVIITSPVGFTKNNRPLLQYSVSAGTVVVKVDGAVVSKVSGDSLDLLADGSHTLRVEAANNGVTGFAVSTFTVDTIAPTVTVSPLPAIVKAETQTLSGTMETGSNVVVTVTIGTASLGTVTYPTTTTWQCVVNNLTVGTNSFTITAYDQAGNSRQVFTSFSYALPVSLRLSVPSIAADFKDRVVLTVSNIDPAGSEVLIEQLVDVNHNGIIDAADYVIRSFKVSDGTASGKPNLQGDEDGTINSIITTSLNFLLANDLYHAPGHYLFKATKDTETAIIPFVVDPVSQVQTVSGTVTDGTTSIPGALVRLLDKWQRPVTATIADDNGAYVLNITQPGDYMVVPVVYGYVAPATPVNIVASQSLVNQTLTLTAGSYHVTGNLKDATSGIGIAGVWVQASDGNNSAIAITNSNGVYDLALPSGQYTLNVYSGASGPGAFAKGYAVFNNQPLSIGVNGTMAASDISLPVGDITASGRVLDLNGNPVPGVPVMGKIKGTLDSREPVSFGISDAAGNYSLGLFSGTNWDISLDNAAAQTLGYLGTVRHDLSTAVGPLTGNDLTIHPITAWIQGTVTNSANQLLSGVEVRLRNADSSITASVFTTQDGSYRLGAFAGNWFIDALNENTGIHPVTEQAFSLSDSQTTTIDFTVDVTPPSVTINPVASPTKVTSQTITGTMEAGATVTVGVNTAASIGPVSYPTSTTWSCTITGLVEGPNAIIVTATDAAGNPTVIPASITLDTIAPTVVITSPTSGSVTSQTPLLTYTVSDGSIVVKVDTVIVNKISGSTLDTLSPGSHTVRVEATDAAGNLGFALVSFSVNQPPAFNPTTISRANATVGIAYTGQTIAGAAIDPEGDAITYSKISGPAWLTIATNGTLSGTPTTASSDSFIVRATASGGTNDATLNITVVPNQPPAFNPTTISKANATVGIAYTGQTLSGAATDPEGDTITYTKVSGPAWLTVAANGSLSGTPTVAASDSFIVRATATGGTNDAALNITVVAAPVAVAQLNAWTNLYSAVPNTTSKTNLAAGSFTVGTGTNRLLLVAVVMEIGTAANPTISASYGGTALTLIKTTANTQREIVWMGYLKDAQIGSGSKALTVTYSGATGKASALHVNWAAFSGVNQTTPVAGSGGTNAASTSATFGTTISYVTNGMTTVVAGNGGTPATGALSASPAFAADTATTTNAQTSRTFTTAKHTAAGSYAGSTAVTWTGTTSTWSGSVVASLQPALPNQPPVFSPTTISRANSNVNLAYTGQTIAGAATDPEGDAITYTKVSGPAWLTVAADGTLSGTPTTASSDSFIVRATATGGTNDATLNITVVVNQPPAFNPTTISKANATVGIAYAGQTIAGAATDPEGDTITYTKVSGPAWLTVATNGTLSGTPTVAANASFIVRATAMGGTNDAVLNITVAAAPVAVAQLNAWANLHSSVPNNTSATNLAAGSFTVGSGTNRLLLVAVVMEIGTAANPTISASYGGIALTQIKVTANTQREIVWVGYLKESQIGSGSKALTVTYSGATGNASALHVNWAAFSGVNQTSPVAGFGGTNAASTSATFGSTINYVTNGMTTVVAGNGGTPATGALSATPAFTPDTATTTNAQTSRTFTTAKHTAAGSYAGTTPVRWSGTTSKWSGSVVVSLQP